MYALFEINFLKSLKLSFDKVASAVVGGANMCLSRDLHALHINLYILIISHSQRANQVNISENAY